MKKILVFLGFMLLLTTPLFAQRAAVMEFKAGVGISQADVDGLSGIFTTYFRPAGFTMVERTQIDRVISEQGFQRSSLTEAQMVRIGEILNLSMIVIGDINVVAGEYNVDARVVNVESGVIIATDGESFRGSYRESMKKLAQRLAGQVAIKPGETVKAAPKPKPAAQRTTPFVIMGYLKVFPNDLGKFDSAPNSVIRQINSQEQHGYNTWRLPTNEELSLMVANSVVSASDSYMTSDSRRSGIVRLVTDKGTAQEIAEEERKEEERRKAAEKTFLSRWSSRSSNEMNWQSAINYCQNLTEGGYTDWRLPNIDELRGLIKNCSKTEIGGECRVSEKNSCLSYSQCENGYRDGSCYCASINNNGGYYSKLGDDDKVRLWSSSTRSDYTDVAWVVYFGNGGVTSYDKSNGYYVRCVR
ncbi:DUF1566 domain-containing protein [bacterium]|nr:DUF1566 domain-containing protein [bacterium]